MSEARRTPPPSGLTPPASAPAPDGSRLDLVALAAEVCTRYYAEYADEDARYGEAGRLWCQHDNQHLLNWAAESVSGLVDLEHEVAWLARVLDKRDFPLDRLARNLELDAAVVRDHVPSGEPIGAALDSAAAMVRTTFLA